MEKNDKTAKTVGVESDLMFLKNSVQQTTIALGPQQAVELL